MILRPYYLKIWLYKRSHGAGPLDVLEGEVLLQLYVVIDRIINPEQIRPAVKFPLLRHSFQVFRRVPIIVFYEGNRIVSSPAQAFIARSISPGNVALFIQRRIIYQQNSFWL